MAAAAAVLVSAVLPKVGNGYICRRSHLVVKASSSPGEDGISKIVASPIPQEIIGTSILPKVQEEVAAGSISKELERIYERCRVWLWRGHRIKYVALQASAGPSILLVHGFGASIGHWRRNLDVLSKDYSVFALDLLGQGASDKPPGFLYSIETWGELVVDFMNEVICSPTVLIGNSIGSLICLTAAADSPKELVRGVVLLNCAGGMNNKAVVDDWRIKLFLPLLWLVDWLLKQPSISSSLFNRARSRENLKSVLSSVYCNKEAVDEELIEIIRRPAEDVGALDAFVSIITGPPGPTPMSLIPKIDAPLLVLWGDKDPFTPIDGPVGRYFVQLPLQRSSVQLLKLDDVGHCPHDDRPQLVHELLLPWLRTLVRTDSLLLTD